MPEILKHTRENVAHHEAGHAVIAYLTGYHIIDEPIHIDGEATEDGHAVTPIAENDELMELRRQDGWVIDEFERRKQRCAIAVAGYAAEELLAARTDVVFDDRLAFLGAHGDVQNVIDLWGSRSFLKFKDSLIPAMGQKDVWAMVSTLAKALLAHEGPMPAEKAMQVLEQSMMDTGANFRLFFPTLKQQPKPEVSPDTVPPQ